MTDAMVKPLPWTHQDSALAETVSYIALAASERNSLNGQMGLAHTNYVLNSERLL